MSGSERGVWMTGKGVREAGLRAGHACRLDHEREGSWKHKKSHDLEYMHKLIIVISVRKWVFFYVIIYIYDCRVGRIHIYLYLCA